MSIITVRVDEKDLREVEQKLTGLKKPEAALRTAINRVAKSTSKSLARQTVKVYRYGAGQSGINGALNFQRASGSGASARLLYVSKVKEPRDYFLAGGISYGYRRAGEKTKRFRIKTGAAGALYRAYSGGVRGAVLKSSSAKTFKGETGKAFIVKFKSGHVAVVSRKPNEVASKYKGKKLTKHTQKLRAWRSPSVATIVGNEKVYGKIQPDIEREMHEEVQKVIEKVLYG